MSLAVAAIDFLTMTGEGLMTPEVSANGRWRRFCGLTLFRALII